LARDITDQEAARALKAMPLICLSGQRPSNDKAKPEFA
jgi:hypothetical protein